jgi:type IV secretory pathway protease TraF
LRSQRYHALENAIVAAAAVGVALWWHRRRPFTVAVEGDSMEPTLQAGQYLVALAKEPATRGALVVLAHPDHADLEMVKRVAGVPGDRIRGRLLQPEELWVVGDNASASTDSRWFGPVPCRAVRGVVRLRYWPASRLTWFPRVRGG